MKVVVMGQGYVGLPLAMAAVKAGHDVVGFEPDKARFESLRSGTSYIEDVPDSALAAAMQTGRYEPARDPAMLWGFDIAVITVPTPLKDRVPDLTFVASASAILGGSLKHGATVILESTTHPGTTREVVVPILESTSGLVAGKHFHVGFSPERIDPGNPKWTFENTPKIYSGLTPTCEAQVWAFYNSITAYPIRANSLEEAELAKVFENTYRHVNIALVNELQRLAHSFGIDVWNVLELAGSKPFGFTKFLPGPGVGGHCLPVDPVYLSHHVKTALGETFRLVELAQDINEAQPAYVVRRLQDALNDRFGKALKGSRILALGQAYKAGTSDMRESPAVEVASLLAARGAWVEAVDPFDAVSDYTGIYDRLGDYNAVVLLTAHDEFDLAKIADSGVFVLDTRGVLPGGDNIERL